MSRPINKRAKPVKDAKFYAEWNKRHTHCQCCGIPEHHARSLRWPGLSTHHIIKLGRADEAPNLLRLCQRCHDLAENRQIRDPQTRQVLDRLPLAVCLTLKFTREPDQFDAVRLAELYKKNLPEMEPIPAGYELEYRRWKPFDKQRYFYTVETPGPRMFTYDEPDPIDLSKYNLDFDD